MLRNSLRYGFFAISLIIGGVVPSIARAQGVLLDIETGVAGSSTASSSSEFWFDTPHGPPPAIALTKLTGVKAADADSAGGKVLFNGASTPVLLSTADGASYIAAGSPPASATSPGFGGSGGSGGRLASAAPQAGAIAPSTAALLGITVGTPDSTGHSTLTASFLDSLGNATGGTSVTVPNGGWWVIGLTPEASGSTPGSGTGTGTGGGNDPPPIPTPTPTAGGPTTPEPTSALLLGIAAGCGGLYRRIARKRAFIGERGA